MSRREDRRDAGLAVCDAQPWNRGSRHGLPRTIRLRGKPFAQDGIVRSPRKDGTRAIHHDEPGTGKDRHILYYEPPGSRQIGKAMLGIASAESDRAGSNAMRIAIAIVFLWIGALKFAPCRCLARHGG